MEIAGEVDWERRSGGAELAGEVDQERRSCWRVVLGSPKLLARLTSRPGAPKLLARSTGSAEVAGEVKLLARSTGVAGEVDQ